MAEWPLKAVSAGVRKSFHFVNSAVCVFGNTRPRHDCLKSTEIVKWSEIGKENLRLHPIITTYFIFGMCLLWCLQLYTHNSIGMLAMKDFENIWWEYIPSKVRSKKLRIRFPDKTQMVKISWPGKKLSFPDFSETRGNPVCDDRKQYDNDDDT